MKYFLKISLIAVLIALGSLTACKKKSSNPTDNLPPITQEGKNTFGCLINGEVFVPKKNVTDFDSGPVLQCYYQYINDNYSTIQGYFFGLSATDKKRKPVYHIYINTTNKAIGEGEYDLGPTKTEGAFSAQFAKGSLAYSENRYFIEHSNKGKIKITRFDEVNQIVSGTFWFDAVNEQGEKVEVREGRFDMNFTR